MLRGRASRLTWHGPSQLCEQDPFPAVTRLRNGWWVAARSAREILETFAGVEVVDRPETLVWARTEDLVEVDIDAAVMPAGLDDLWAARDRQRPRDGFGVFADRTVVYLRRRRDGEDSSIRRSWICSTLSLWTWRSPGTSSRRHGLRRGLSTMGRKPQLAWLTS